MGSLEGNVLISNNDITRNDIGALFVRQHVNAVDFERLNSGKEMPRFEGNNIFANRTYNFSLGEGQERDVSVTGNWWGGAKRATIAELMYDRSTDASLSNIIYEPYLFEPVRNTGANGLRAPATGQGKTGGMQP